MSPYRYFLSEPFQRSSLVALLGVLVVALGSLMPAISGAMSWDSYGLLVGGAAVTAAIRLFEGVLDYLTK